MQYNTNVESLDDPIWICCIDMPSQPLYPLLTIELLLSEAEILVC